MAYKTIPVTRETWERLKDYKMAGATYDEVLRELMKSVPIEVVAERVVREHYGRMREWEGRPWREVLQRRRQR